MSKAIAKELLNKTKVPDTKGTSDTIHLWEGYRDQALLWRSLALLQIPATLLSIVLALFLWSSRKVELIVPAKPLPGIHEAKSIPDTEFIDKSTEFINLIATYQPAVARRQYEKAVEMVAEPLLTQFKNEMLDAEIKTIEQTQRTQVLYVDPTKTKVTRNENGEIQVTVVGDRQKFITGHDIGTVQVEYVLTMRILPHNALNPYGIYITNLSFRTIE